MRKLVFTLLLCLSPLLTHAQSSSVRALTAPVTKNVAYLSQQVLITGESTTSLGIAPVTTSNAGFGLNKMITKFSTSPFGEMPSMAIANPTTPQAALATASQWVSLSLPTFKNSFSSYLAAQGLSEGFFNYTQEIMVSTATGPQKQAIAFNASIDLNGRPTYGDPKIVNPNPTIIEVTYTPLAATQGLPPSWVYPNAGTLTWRLLDSKYQVLSDWTVINTAGAFDSSPTDTNPDAKLDCLMDSRHAGCTYPLDINQLINQTGASFGLVNYIRALTPIYKDNGDGTQSPIAAISVDSRTYDCATYTNTGEFGVLLSLVSDQYVAQQTTSLVQYQLLQELTSKGLSPTEPYSKAVPASALGSTPPSAVIISPGVGDDSFWSINDPAKMANVIYVAPVTNTNSGALLKAGDFSGNAPISVNAISGSASLYTMGTPGGNYWSSGIYDQQTTFSLSNPAGLDMFALTNVQFDDWLMVSVNGNPVYVGPFGGNMLQIAGGVQENNCSQNSDGTFGCVVATAQEWGSAGSGDGGYMCPPNTVLVGDTCYVAGTKTYNYCYGAGNADRDGGVQYYLCSQGCASGLVQYLSSGVGYGPGCKNTEQYLEWNFSPNIDLRPYLVPGQNTIQMHSIVGGSGHSWITLESQTCSALQGLDTVTPPVPGGAGGAGVTDKLRHAL